MDEGTEVGEERCSLQGAIALDSKRSEGGVRDALLFRFGLPLVGP